MSTGCSVINLWLQVGTKMRSRKGRNGWLVINIQDVYPMVQYWHKTKFISCLPFSSLLCLADLLVRIVLHNSNFSFRNLHPLFNSFPSICDTFLVFLLFYFFFFCQGLARLAGFSKFTGPLQDGTICLFLAELLFLGCATTTTHSDK